MLERLVIMSYNAEQDSSDICYTYDGTFDGLLTAIFTAVYSRKTPLHILPADRLQLAFGERYINIVTEAEKAARVMNAVTDKLGSFGAKRLYYVFLSDAADKEIIIYKYMMLGFRNGSIVNSALADDTVSAACNAAQNVSREAEKFRQFTRFSIMEGGVHYARIVPKNNVLPIITPFFLKRLHSIPFIINDLTHDICSVYNTRSWYITSSVGITPPEASENEKELKRLWKIFFDSVSIKERENLKLQKQNMGARYFKDVWSVK